MNLLQIDETKLSHDEFVYLDELLFNKFQKQSTFREEARMILKIRERLGMDIRKNSMLSDFEHRFNERYKPINNIEKRVEATRNVC